MGCGGLLFCVDFVFLLCHVIYFRDKPCFISVILVASVMSYDVTLHNVIDGRVI